MVSFDVASIFTNIPLDETVNIILDNLFSGTDEVQVENCVFSKPQFKKLLEFAVKNNHFIFNDHLLYSAAISCSASSAHFTRGMLLSSAIKTLPWSGYGLSIGAQFC